MRGKSHDVAVGPSRLGAAALMLALLLSAGAADAKTMKQCQADAKAGNKSCNQLPEPGQCLGQVSISLERCACESRGGVLTQSLGVYQCSANSQPHPPASWTPPTPKPRGPRPGPPRPLSHPEQPVKPQGPGSVGTPPKSNPTPGVKPQGPHNVGSPPKSHSSSGGGGGGGSGGPILRSGNSGHSNPKSGAKSGGGNSGGSKH